MDHHIHINTKYHTTPQPENTQQVLFNLSKTLYCTRDLCRKIDHYLHIPIAKHLNTELSTDCYKTSPLEVIKLPHTQTLSEQTWTSLL